MFSTPLNPFYHTQNESDMKRNFNEAQMKKKYRSHNIYVSARVQPSNLLVFNVKDGWEPLCQFLERPVPNFPFPRVNINGGADGYMKTFWSDSLFMKQCQKEALITISAIFFIIFILAAVITIILLMI